jgi:shikimate dehydrogenase
MIQLGLLGYPLTHSLSPAIHNAALYSCGLAGRYSLFPVQPDDKEGLQELLESVRRGKIRGLNVTIPHKQNVIEFLDDLTPTARAIGAVNTIYYRDGSLTGDNTDAPGFIADLKHTFDSSFFIRPPSALVLGAGGSARAVVYALLNDGWYVTVAARRLEQADQLADGLAHRRLQTTDFRLSRIDLSSISLIVNTTPVGMTPNTEHSPWPASLAFPPHAAIYDLVYNPQETKLVRDAHRQGLLAATGLGMLIEQAALSFEIWTGQTASRKFMLSAIAQSPIHHL